MLELVLFSIPTVLYILFRRNSLPDALRVMGLVRPHWIDVWLALGVGFVCVIISLPLQFIISADMRSSPQIVLIVPTLLNLLGVIARAAGEEIFFRGFLLGLLELKCRPVVAIALQGVVFLLPHLALLAVSTSYWILLPFQFVAGVVFGIIRYRTGSIAAPVAIHALVNITQALL